MLCHVDIMTRPVQQKVHMLQILQIAHVIIGACMADGYSVTVAVHPLAAVVFLWNTVKLSFAHNCLNGANLNGANISSTPKWVSLRAFSPPGVVAGIVALVALAILNIIQCVLLVILWRRIKRTERSNQSIQAVEKEQPRTTGLTPNGHPMTNTDASRNYGDNYMSLAKANTSMDLP
ncbi:uncharacterized protein LOC106150619 [Lingula anatina]|uniref:Uncharacterized protein LOC106150619 n=1 Tax=Lingula anatina TaxID=7574 RepID=A0A1S3GYN0_LINAN|nr:uncharacterized protein LOC106150619 [Lingula anatina]XP_013378987.1 uncharacterized protein LOC106150619 [Lingula anatina]|eukprot:XP_013378980.1 uncharacterized protein LOC106150619 [Lingula anatina]